MNRKLPTPPPEINGDLDRRLNEVTAGMESTERRRRAWRAFYLGARLLAAGGFVAALVLVGLHFGWVASYALAATVFVLFAASEDVT